MTPNDETPPKDFVLVRYGELGLKKNNRGLFEDQLRENIEHRLSSLETGRVKRFQGGMRVNLNASSPVSKVLALLGDVPGIAWYGACWESNRDPETIAQKILDCGQPEKTNAESFALSTQRSDKDLNLTSQDYNETVGRKIDEQTDLHVDLDNPDWPITIHLLYDRACFFFEEHKGLGGLPVEASGEVLSLLSGGIDSPVASIRTFKRGCRQDFLHYYPYPEVEEALDRKIRDLVSRLSDFGTHGKLYMAPYHRYDLQAPPVETRDEIIVFRRHMLRVANRIARQSGLRGIVTGGSLGQVASQTLENLHTISAVADLPVLRPLIGMDKQEIINLAQDYGTYDLSLRDYRDCCSIQSTRVRTRSRKDRFRTLEDKHNVYALDEEVLEGIEVFEYGSGDLR